MSIKVNSIRIFFIRFVDESAFQGSIARSGLHVNPRKKTVRFFRPFCLDYFCFILRRQEIHDNYIFASAEIYFCRKRISRVYYFKDTLINSTSISASCSCVKDSMIASSESAKNTVDSAHCGHEAPFGRPREARWLCHSSLCGAATLHCFGIPCQRASQSL